MSNIKKRSEGGFTIIEVLIVLAIAGLIMLIVFLAVPALQRNSRNTQRKNDASAIASAVANFISNNGGSLPTGVTATSNPILITGSTGNSESAKLGYYTTSAANITLTATSTTQTDPEKITIVTGYGCNSTGTAIGSPSSRTAAILYATENGNGGGSAQCIEQ